MLESGAESQPLVTAHQGMALMELGQKGIPLDKLIVGKPVTSEDVNNSGCVNSLCRRGVLLISLD